MTQGVEFPVRAVLDDKGVATLIAQLTKAGKEAGLSEKQIKEMNDALKRTGKEGVGHVNALNDKFNNLTNSTLKRVGAAVVAAFAIDRLIDYGKQIVAITSEFQKFEAVLTNTLGSKSRAQIAIRQIQEFAAKTPFSVKELTESFVKLANQGFRPTQEEMRKLGDLAASTGKTFDMLTEAIIDAQTGEFERLKEFGIRASKAGDNVTFTFKGVETQTKFTSEAIRQYVLSLGDAVGVSGAMASISETVGGKISNMGDAWDRLFNTLGDGQSGPLKNAINNITLLIEKTNEYVQTEEQRAKAFGVEKAAKAVENLKTLARAYGNLNEAAKDYKRMIQGNIDAEQKYNDGLDRTADDTEDAIKQSYAKIDALKAELVAIDEYVQDQDALNKRKEKGIKLTKEEIEAQKKLAEEQRMLLEMLARQNTQKFLKSMQRPGLPDAPDVNGDSFLEAAFHKKMEEDKTKATKENSEERDRIRQKEFNKEVERIERERELQQAASSAIISIASSVADFKAAKNDEELSRLTELYNYEINAAGDNEEAKERIKKDFDRREAELKRKQAQRDRDYNLFQIFVNTASAVVEALPNVVLAEIVGAAGLVQEVLVASKPLPKFARGKYKIQGPGTETSDSIPSLLSKNESVVDAEKSRKWGFFLEPMIEGREDEAIRNMIHHLRGDLFNPPAASDSNSILADINRKLGQMKQLNVNIDEDGFQKWTRNGQQWTQYVNKRYRF